MRVLVFGGCGFIGSHITDALLASGHQVRVLSHSPERFRAPLENVEYHIGEFSDAVAVDASLSDVDVVIHAISTNVPGTSNKDPLADIRGNLMATVQLLDLMRRHAIRRIVYLSSGGTVYGNSEHCPVSENVGLHPICSYGVIKVAVVNYLSMYRDIYGLEPTVLRLSNPYGPRQGHFGVQGVITSFMKCMLRGKSLQIWGDGSQVRDYVHVVEVARICVQSVESSHAGIVNVGSGGGYSLLEVISMIASVTGRNSELEFLEERPLDVKRIVLDISKVRETFGWSPEIILQQGLREYWLWMMERAHDTGSR